MSINLNAENRNVLLPLPVRRCCSLCRNTGHNISTCNDSRLIQFEQLCVERKGSLSVGQFRDWIEDYSRVNPIIVKSYAVRYCGCTIRQHMFSYIDYIIRRIQTLSSRSRDIVQQRENQYSNLRQHEIRPNGRLQMQQEILHESQELALLQETQAFTLLVLRRIRDMAFLRSIITAELSLEEQTNEIRTNRKFNIQTKILEYINTDECECNICYDSKEKQTFIKFNCSHEFCKDCVKQTLKNVRTEKPQCALCRAEIKNMELTSQEIRDEFNDLITLS